MNMKSLRTGLAAAMGGAVLLAGLLVGASFAFAQEGEEPDESSLDRLFGLVEDAATDVSADGDEALEQIVTDLLTDVAPLVDQIKDRILVAVDEAVAADVVTEEEGAKLKEGIAAFELPDELPFPIHRFGLGDQDFGVDGNCFPFRLGPEGAEMGEDCPDFELPEGFPFGPQGLEFEGRPFGFFGDELDGFLEELDVDLDGLLERLGTGMSLDEALTDLDVDREQLLSDLRNNATTEIDKLVEEGKLTQDRADSIKEMLEGIDLSEGFPFGLRYLDSDFGEFDFDGFRGPRGHGHGFDFFDNDESAADVNGDEAVFDE